MKKVYQSSENSTAPLSQAYEANGLVFVSGQIHTNSKGILEGTNVEERLDMILSKIKNILSEANLSLENIIKVNIYITNIKELPDLNKVYPKYFNHPLPARTSVEVSNLPLGASLEIEVIASRENK